MTADTVLLVTASYDESAQHVSESLDNLGSRSFRLDTDRFPTEVKATFDPDVGLSIRDKGTSVHSAQIKSVWYRRNVAPTLPDYISDYEREFCARETKAFLEGALASIPTNRWLSKPSAIWRAERKMYQLAVARELGFNIPPTVVTNDETTAQHFARRREAIAKAVSSGYIDSPDGYRAMFTTALAPTDVNELEGLCLAPVTFQERVRKTADIRVTVIGNDIFAAEIMSQSHESSKTDWRATENPDIEHRSHELPHQLESQCLALVKQLGLAFGAIDLALDEEGQYRFFEINPNGEWLWLEYQLGFPISEKISLWLSQVI